MFRTIFKIPESEYKINPALKLMFFGSCFTENIGKRIELLQLKSVLNPFGILYNPATVADNLRIIIGKKLFSDNDLEFNNDKWLSFHHHGRFSNSDKQICLKNINYEFLIISTNFFANTL